MDNGFVYQERILRLEEVKKMTSLSRSTIYAWVAEGTFPPKIHLGNRSVGWIEKEVADWIKARIAESRKPGNG